MISIEEYDCFFEYEMVWYVNVWYGVCNPSVLCHLSEHRLTRRLQFNERAPLTKNSRKLSAGYIEAQILRYENHLGIHLKLETLYLQDSPRLMSM